MDEKLRIDKYLWAIRLFKTRSQASDACDKGRVKADGHSLKASKSVSVGDVYEVKTEARKWVIEVMGLLPKRVAYSEAIKFYKDITPPEALDHIAFQAPSFHTGKRLSKVGRPTKRDRRDMDQFLDDGIEAQKQQKGADLENAVPQKAGSEKRNENTASDGLEKEKTEK